MSLGVWMFQWQLKLFRQQDGEWVLGHSFLGSSPASSNSPLTLTG